MGWPETKYALNGTIGTGYKESLDQLLGAKIVCRGHIGAKFTLTRADGYYTEKTAEITEDSQVKDGTPFEIVPVPVGTYNLQVSYGEVSTSVAVNASVLGATYVPSYDLKVVLAEYTSPGTYKFEKPDNLLASTIYITACGGGAGGSAGGTSTGTGGGGRGGNGGGAASSIKEKAYSAASITTLSIKVGSGGASASAGSATTIGSLLTLAGGTVGNGYAGGAGGQDTSGREINAKPGSNGGGAYGGAGGATGTITNSYVTNYWCSGSGGGGQGGNCIGNGGSGGRGSAGVNNGSGVSGGNGSRGGGGGGGGGGQDSAGSGGRGGDGYVKIETILSMK